MSSVCPCVTKLRHCSHHPRDGGAAGRRLRSDETRSGRNIYTVYFRTAAGSGLSHEVAGLLHARDEPLERMWRAEARADVGLSGERRHEGGLILGGRQLA